MYVICRTWNTENVINYFGTICICMENERKLNKIDTVRVDESCCLDACCAVVTVYAL